jgi:hypothetical protein
MLGTVADLGWAWKRCLRSVGVRKKQMHTHLIKAALFFLRKKIYFATLNYHKSQLFFIELENQT